MAEMTNEEVRIIRILEELEEGVGSEEEDVIEEFVDSDDTDEDPDYCPDENKNNSLEKIIAEFGILRERKNI